LGIGPNYLGAKTQHTRSGARNFLELFRTGGEEFAEILLTRTSLCCLFSFWVLKSQYILKLISRPKIIYDMIYGPGKQK